MILVDSNVFIASENKDDTNHLRAKSVLELIQSDKFGSLILPDYVFDEILTHIAARRGKSRALEIGNWLLSSGLTLIYISEPIFKEAWGIFQKSSELSFTDCVIVAFAREKNAAIATFDGRFSPFKEVRIVS